MARIDDLRDLRELLWLSIREADAEKRAPLVNQMRGVLSELAELGDGAGGERTGLIDFQEALAERKQSAAKGAYRP